MGCENYANYATPVHVEIEPALVHTVCICTVLDFLESVKNFPCYTIVSHLVLQNDVHIG